MEKKRLVAITLLGLAEIIIGIITLLFSLLLIMSMKSTWGFGIFLGLPFGVIAIFLIIAGKLTLQARSLGRKINIILFCIIGALCLASALSEFPKLLIDIGESSVNIIPLVFTPLVLLLAYVSFVPKVKEQFK